MTFSEFVIAEESANSAIDSVFAKCNAFLEASNREYEINLKEARCKVLEESGTYDDLAILENAASEGLVGRAKKTIEKMVNELVEFVKKLVKAVEDFFGNAKTSLTLKKAEAAAKTNPKLKSLTFSVPDIQKIDKENMKFVDQAKRRVAMLKSGKVSDKDIKGLRKEKADHEKNLAKTLKLEISVTVAGAILLIKTFMDKLKEKPEKVVKVDKNYLDNVFAEDVDKAVEVIQNSLTATKIRFSHIASALKGIMKRLSGAIRGKDVRLVDPINIGESVESLPEDITDPTQCPNEAKAAEQNKNTKEDTSSIVSNLIGEVKAKKAVDGLVNEVKGKKGCSTCNESTLSAEDSLSIIEEMINDDEVNTESADDLKAIEDELFNDEVNTESADDLKAIEDELFNDEVNTESVDNLKAIEDELFGE